MIVLKGKGVFGGIAIGNISFYKRKESQVKRYHIDDAKLEIARFQDGKEKAISQLKQLYEKALQEVGEANAAIFDIHQMMLEDLDYQESVLNIIHTQQVNAEYAVATTGDNFSAMFSAMDDEYMKERATDVRDISDRLVNILSNETSNFVSSDKPVIVAADDLVPSETVQLDKNKVLAFVTQYGSVNSHTAIIARTMNIPAIIDIGVDLKEEYDNEFAIVDGFTGELYIEPDEETRKRLTEKQKEDLHKKALLQELKGKENITLDGQKINIYANIGSSGDVAAVLKHDAGGIGLFRSECLYLENTNFPTEEEQFLTYKQVVENMGGRKVIIRTLDIGADKQVDYFHLPKEENPALGYRAIRICLTQVDIFKTQLRALLRASVFGKLAIMFPMITSVEEVREIKTIVEEVKKELKEQDLAFDKTAEMGIMIETPAAAMISDLLAQEVDFFSIGTNDLTQYTLAIDRQNPKLDKFYNAHHVGLLRLIKVAADNAHKYGIWIGICGELGADLQLTETFLKMGIDELSVSPALVLPLREKVRQTNVSQLPELRL